MAYWVIKGLRKISVIVLLLLFVPHYAGAGDAGSRASFTRGGWVGAEYAAMGMAAEVVADDVYAIYWNPAGLTELIGKKMLTEKDIIERAKSGEVDKISESDLLNFSEDKKKRSFFQIGFSAAMLDIERDAAFTGFAFDAFDGVLGAGIYSIVSTGIEERDDSGNLVSNDLKYIGSVSYISYAWTAGISSIGFSLKGLYEKIGDAEFAGAGSDFGAQIYFLPFLKIGFVVQDIGSGLMPVKNSEDIERKYDFAKPSLKIGGSITSDTGVVIAVTAVKKLEQDKYQINSGLKYDMLKGMTVFLGMNDSNFSTGFSLKLYNFNVSYAFIIDKINYGYNNLASISFLF